MNETRAKITKGKCDDLLDTLAEGCLALLTAGDPYGTAENDLKAIRARQEAIKPRMARCGYYGKRCKSERPSSEKANLAFFQETPERDYDDYYCGCYGWN